MANTDSNLLQICFHPLIEFCTQLRYVYVSRAINKIAGIMQ